MMKKLLIFLLSIVSFNAIALSGTVAITLTGEAVSNDDIVEESVSVKLVGNR